MLALVLDPRRRLELRTDHPEPQPGADEVLVHVRKAGVCDTDLALCRGYAEFSGVLGHEFVGEVDERDAELGGRRVVADINVGCGHCQRCRADDEHHCARRTTVGIRDRPGIFAERVALPRRNLVALPEWLDDDLAVFCEPLAAGLHVLDALPPAVDEPVWVLGDGKLGLLTALALRAADREVRLVGHHRSKLALAASAGIEGVLEDDLQASDEGSAAAVVEATGSPSGLARALSLVRARGSIVLKTTLARPLELDVSRIVVDELRVIGSRCGDMRQAVELLASGRVDPRPLIAARYPLVEAARALEHARRRGALKVLIEARGPGGATGGP